MALTIAIIGAATTIAGTVSSISSQKKAAAAQRRAANIEAQRARVRAIREARIKRATITASAAQGGVLGSSGAIGGAGSILSQTGGQLDYLNKTAELGQQVSNYQGQAAIGGAVAGIGQDFFSSAGGFKTIFNSGFAQNLFSTGGTTK